MPYQWHLIDHQHSFGALRDQLLMAAGDTSGWDTVVDNSIIPDVVRARQSLEIETGQEATLCILTMFGA